MSQQLQITGGAKVRDLNDVIIGTSGVLSSLAFNVANGVPKLDVNGKILVSQLPNSVMEYQGTWNAATNTPTLVNGTGNQGDVYLCNVAGTTNFGAGPITFAVGDSAIYSGTIWQKAGGATGTVTSVGLTSTGNDAITITGSPITTSGNINLGFAGTNLQYINGAGDLTTFPTLISSIGLTMPSAFSVANSPLTSNGTIAVTGAGYPSQYIRGDGTLADFPTSGGGGSSVSYYLNGGTSQGTIGGVTYYEMSKTADTGTGVDFTKSGDGFIVAFLTDAGDPAQLNIPAGNWNYEIYASMSANGGTPQMYAELYVYNGTTFTLIATSSNEILYDGTNLNLYTFAMTVPATTLTLTDRLAIKLYATNSGGKTTTVHTQDSHLCQIITTFSTGITALNGLTAQVQYFATGTSGTDFNISSTTATHTFNIPSASATNRGLITTGSQTIAGDKAFTGINSFDYGINYKTGASLANVSGYISQAYAKSGTGAGSTLSLKISDGNSVKAINLDFVGSPATYTYTFPAASGTIALTSSLSSYVPYTGATGDVNLGYNSLKGLDLFIQKNAANGAGGLNFQLSTVGTTNYALNNQDYFSLYTLSTYYFGGTWNVGGITKTFLFYSNNIANNSTRYIGFPSLDGTLAVTSQLDLYLPLTGGIMTGSILLNNNLTISGQLFGTSSYASMLAMSPSDKVLIDNSGRGVIFGGTIGQGAYTYTFPSASGTLALTSDIPSLANYVTLNTIQTISANKTFSEFGFFDKGVLLKQNNYPSASGYNGIGAISGGFYFSLGQTTVQTLLFNTSTPYQYTFPSATGTLPLGTGTTNYHAKWTGTNTIGNSLIWDNGTNVGIGNTNTSYTLDVSGTVRATGNIITTGSGYFVTATSLAMQLNGSIANDFQLNGGGPFRVVNQAYNAVLMQVNNNGNVGIGATPSAWGSFTALQLANGVHLASYTSGVNILDFGINYYFDGANYIYNNTDAASSLQMRNGEFRFNTAPSGTAGTACTLTERMRITSGGNVEMYGNTLVKAASLAIGNNAAAGVVNITLQNNQNGYQFGINAACTQFQFLNGAPTVVATINGASGVYTALSDINKKKDFEESIIGLSEILQLKPTLYRFKDCEENAIKDLGFIAQEVKEFIPQAYVESGDEDDKFIGLNYNPIVAALVKAIQEQNQTIQNLQEQINILAK